MLDVFSPYETVLKRVPPLREGGGQRPGWMCLIEAQICAADSSFSFYGLLISRPTASGIPFCAFGAALLQGPAQLARWTFSHPMRQFLNAFPLREGGGQRPGWMCLIEAQICAADPSFSFLRLSHKSPYRFEDPSCAFGAALLQGPTQLARWTFSRPMRQFLNAFPLREGGGQRPGWMCLIEAQICAADSSFSFYGLLISRPTASRIHPAPLARPFSKGLLAGDCLTFAFMPPIRSYLALLSC